MTARQSLVMDTLTPSGGAEVSPGPVPTLPFSGARTEPDTPIARVGAGITGVSPTA